jgi:hypothetical protein
LLATGAEKPFQGEIPVSVGGSVQFLAGNSGIGNAVVQVVDTASTVILQDTTDANGAFNLEVLLSEVQPGWQLKVIKEGNPTNGVNAIDLVRIQKHILFVDPMDNPFSKIAADANGSGTINSLDIVTLLRLLLGISPNFPDLQSWILS